MENNPPQEHAFIDHEALIMDACFSLTGEMPDAERVLSKIGRWLRFGQNNGFALKVHEVDGGYIYIIQDHVSGESAKGCTAAKNEAITPEQRREYARKRKQHEQARAAKLARKDRMLSAMVKRLWPLLDRPESRAERFPYLRTKREVPKNVRFFESHKRDVMVVPMVCCFAGLKSFYLITATGFKRPLLGTATTGLMMAISYSPLEQASRIGIVEGYATGLTVSRLFRVPVVVAFTCHNLISVIEKLRRKYPNAELVLYADSDVETFEKRGFNPGLDAAKKVQEQFPEVEVVIPEYPPDATGCSDFNDLNCWLEDQNGGLQHD